MTEELLAAGQGLSVVSSSFSFKVDRNRGGGGGGSGKYVDRWVVFTPSKQNRQVDIKGNIIGPKFQSCWFRIKKGEAEYEKGRCKGRFVCLLPIHFLE